VAKGLNAISWQRPSGSAVRASGLDELRYLDWAVRHHASEQYLGMASRIVVRCPHLCRTTKRTDRSVNQLSRRQANHCRLAHRADWPGLFRANSGINPCHRIRAKAIPTSVEAQTGASTGRSGSACFGSESHKSDSKSSRTDRRDASLHRFTCCNGSLAKSYSSPSDPSCTVPGR
jgi:hypothetical protein